MDPVNQFMALPIVGEQHVVFDGEFDRMCLGDRDGSDQIANLRGSVSGRRRKCKPSQTDASPAYWCRCFMAAAQRMMKKPIQRAARW